MDVRRLELLRELADRGTITAVAAATHRTASAVSQQLKLLEAEAGVPLTEKEGRGIRLTGAGRALAETARRIAVAIESAEALWSEYKQTPTGTVTLSTFPTAGQMLLPGVLSTLEQEPALRLLATDQDLPLADFAELTPDFDIVLADSQGVPSHWNEHGLTTVHLMTEPFDVALPAGHPLLEKSVLSPADVADYPWIRRTHRQPYDRWPRRALAPRRRARAAHRVAAHHGKPRRRGPRRRRSVSRSCPAASTTRRPRQLTSAKPTKTSIVGNPGRTPDLGLLRRRRAERPACARC